MSALLSITCDGSIARAMVADSASSTFTTSNFRLGYSLLARNDQLDDYHFGMPLTNRLMGRLDLELCTATSRRYDSI